jgi:hypothetical protein
MCIELFDRVDGHAMSTDHKHQASLFFVAMSTSAAALSNCPTGQYDPGTGCVPANAGYYVPTTGMTAALPAPIGSYVNGTGASAPTSAAPGSYAPNTGMTAALLALPGTYAPNSGMSAPLNASPGTYVYGFGATAATLAAPGSYVSSAGATSASLASAGYYVPTAGMSAALPAPIGSYVNGTGATAPTLAAPGTFVSVSGSTAANLALPGYYVPSSGASSATAVASGFYAPSAGSVNQLSAGGAAAPLANAIQARSIFNDLSSDLIDSQETSALKIATGFQKSKQDQAGLTSGNFSINSSAVVIQADLNRTAVSSSGLQFAAGKQKLSSGNEAENNSNSYQLSVFKSGEIIGGLFQLQLLLGQIVGDTKRNIAVATSSATSNQTLTSNGKVTWTGLQTQIKYPLNETFKILTQLGVISYNMNGVTETSSVANSIVGLNAESLKYTSVPYTLGLLYDVSVRGDDGILKTPLTATVALVGDLSGSQVLKIHTTYDLDLPVSHTNSAMLFRLKFKAWEPSKDSTLSGTLQAVHGTGLSTYTAGLSFVKKW